jgi:hypothetical protein
LLLVLQGLTDLYLAVALFVPLGGLAAIRLLRSSSRPAAVRLILVLAVAVTLVAVAHGGHLLVRLANPELAMQSPWQSHRIPAEQGALWDLLGLRYFMYDGPDEVPLASLLLIAAGGASFLWRPRIADGTLRQAWRHGVFWVLAGLLLGLPPRLPVGGELVDLPTAWLPFHQVARNTFRLRTATLMGLSILTGLGAAELMRRLTADRVGTSTRWLAAVAMTAIAAAAMYGDLTTRWGRPGALCTPAAVCRPLPASYPLAKPPRLPSPAMLEMLRRPGGALLELPIGTGNGRPWVHAHAMYRSIFHWKPLANGYASYWPADFTARMSTAKALPAAEAVQRLRREIGLDMILLSHDRLSDTERRIWATPAVLRAAGLRVLSRDDSFTLLAVRLGD